MRYVAVQAGIESQPGRPFHAAEIERGCGEGPFADDAVERAGDQRAVAGTEEDRSDRATQAERPTRTASCPDRERTESGRVSTEDSPQRAQGAAERRQE